MCVEYILGTSFQVGLFALAFLQHQKELKQLLQSLVQLWLPIIVPTPHHITATQKKEQYLLKIFYHCLLLKRLQ